jgi:hypothetical protein
MSYLDELIKEKLGGNERKVDELFLDDKVFNELIAKGQDDDWYHYEAKTFDGEYFVKLNGSYSCYRQERGSKSPPSTFDNIHDAAVFHFSKIGYIKSTEKLNKQWWQFWK